MEYAERPTPGPVRRVRIGYCAGEWVIEKEIGIPEMILVTSADLPAVEPEQAIVGFWYEATDAEGKVFYRRFGPDPTDYSVEIFEEDGTIWRTMGQPRDTVFDALIPDEPRITEVRIFAQQPGPDGEPPPHPPKPVAVLEIRQGPEQAGQRGGRDGDK
jgi:hypothetical protein